MDSWKYTDVGGREINEDSIDSYIDGAGNGFFVVCDGLGGHGRGEVASALAVKSIIEKVKEESISADAILEKGIVYAQDTIMQAQADMNAENEMKTTVVCLRVYNGKAQWGHVGDTRLYMWRKRKLFTRTLDHSVPQMLVAAGEIKESQIRFHEDRNRLIRVVGAQWDSPKYDVTQSIDVEKGDAFLLCTDGFWELITEKEMYKCFKKAKTAEEWMNAMSAIVQKRGVKAKESMDNNSAIAVIV